MRKMLHHLIVYLINQLPVKHARWVPFLYSLKARAEI